MDNEDRRLSFSEIKEPGGQEKWDELYQYFKTNKINYSEGIKDVWPPFFGFVKINKTETGNELTGKVFDRFQDSGNLSGSFASGTQRIDDLYDSRALKQAIKKKTNYIKFKFKDNLPSDLKVDYGDTIPWFGKKA